MLIVYIRHFIFHCQKSNSYDMFSWSAIGINFRDTAHFEETCNHSNNNLLIQYLILMCI